MAKAPVKAKKKPANKAKANDSVLRKLQARGIKVASAIKSRTETTTEAKIAQRRKHVKNEQRKPWRVIALAVAILVGVILVGWIALQTPLFAVRSLQVNGSTHQSKDEIAIQGKLKGAQMLDVDPRGSAAAIEQLPWVLQAKVKRTWPDKVTVDITERVSVAVVAAPADSGDAWLLVDASGRLLAPTPERPPSLAQLVEPGDVGAVGTSIDPSKSPGLAVSALLPVELVSRISGVLTNSDGSVDLIMNDGLLVNLGEATDVPSKLEAVLTLLTRADLSDAERIDARVAGTPVIVRRTQSG